MTSRRMFLLGLASFSIAASDLVPGVADAQAKRKKDAPAGTDIVPATPNGGRVIIMRGLWNVFSRGMDALAAKFVAAGLQVTLDSHSNWNKIADTLIEQYKSQKDVTPIILIGHSLGGDASLVMANRLGLEGIPVRLVVVFDAVAHLHPVVASVEEVMNYYKPKGYGQEVKTTANFTGTIRNIDLSQRRDIDHFNIDKDEVLQAEVMTEVFSILKFKPLQPAKPVQPESKSG